MLLEPAHTLFSMIWIIILAAAPRKKNKNKGCVKKKKCYKNRHTRKQERRTLQGWEDGKRLTQPRFSAGVKVGGTSLVTHI